MIDEEHLTRLKLGKESFGQKVVGSIFLMPNFNTPPVTRVVLEGVENVPRDRTVMFALNHTDRYNYWPFQYKMWRRGDLPYTTTWVKGKYYENKWLGWFFDQCNNIPLPSRGYLILQDARALLDRKLDDEEYRVLRDLVDGRLEQDAVPDSASADLRRLLTEARRDFQPADETYAAFMRRWNDRLMGLVEQRTLQALFENHNNVIVFPQGTRSLRLLPGKPGLAQFALRHEIPVVPVGQHGKRGCLPRRQSLGRRRHMPLRDRQASFGRRRSRRLPHRPAVRTIHARSRGACRVLRAGHETHHGGHRRPVGSSIQDGRGERSRCRPPGRSSDLASPWPVSSAGTGEARRRRAPCWHPRCSPEVM